MRQIIYPEEYLEIISMAAKRGLTKKKAKELGIGGQLHHIIPRCVAPELVNEKSNIVFLKHEEHYNAHKILAEANPKDPIAGAWAAMKMKKETQEFFTSEDYAKAMDMSALQSSKRMTGRIVSEETKRKLSERIVSEETRKKMSENHADVSGSNNPRYGKGKIKGAGTPLKKCRAKEYPEIIFNSRYQAEIYSKELGWTGVSGPHIAANILGKRNYCGKDANGNPLHWEDAA